MQIHPFTHRLCCDEMIPGGHWLQGKQSSQKRRKLSPMGRGRQRIQYEDYRHFHAAKAEGWQPVFTRRDKTQRGHPLWQEGTHPERIADQRVPGQLLSIFTITRWSAAMWMRRGINDGACSKQIPLDRTLIKSC